MAQFAVNGMDALERQIADLASLSDAEKLQILGAGAAVLEADLQAAYTRRYTRRTGSLAASIESTEKLSKDGGSQYILVAPNQQKHPGSSTGKRKSRGVRGGGGGRYRGTNAEVAAILEYGSTRITAGHVLETTAEQSQAAVYAAESAAWAAITKDKEN